MLTYNLGLLRITATLGINLKYYLLYTVILLKLKAKLQYSRLTVILSCSALISLNVCNLSGVLFKLNSYLIHSVCNPEKFLWMSYIWLLTC